MATTEENNQLIALFMGFLEAQTGTFKIELNHHKGFHRAIELKFHTSWDWLMPVVSKCYEYGELDNTQREQIIASLSGIIDIEDTHNAVVDFIKWYNENK